MMAGTRAQPDAKSAAVPTDTQQPVAPQLGQSGRRYERQAVADGTVLTDLDFATAIRSYEARTSSRGGTGLRLSSSTSAAGAATRSNEPLPDGMHIRGPTAGARARIASYLGTMNPQVALQTA
jgi:hypothetical protein